MLGIFKIKKIKMEKQQMELEVFALREALDRANTANRELSVVIQNLSKEYGEAADRVRYLAEQLRMKEAQQTASDRFNDNDRNY
jgi:hypothetical protein